MHYLWTYPSPDFLSLSTERDFSVAFWMRSDQAQTQEQILLTNNYYYDSGAGFAIATGGTVGGIKARVGALDAATLRETTATLIGGHRITDQSWRHVAVVFAFSQGKLRLYMDGAQVGETALSGVKGEINRYESAIGDGAYGGDGRSNGFVGDLDELRFYNTALTAQEITVLAQ